MLGHTLDFLTQFLGYVVPVSLGVQLEALSEFTLDCRDDLANHHDGDMPLASWATKACHSRFQRTPLALR